MTTAATAVAMRRERDDHLPRGGDATGGRRRSRETGVGAVSDEFIDILQVQQLLLDSGTAPNGGRSQRYRGRDPGNTAGAGRISDVVFPTPSYYYGSGNAGGGGAGGGGGGFGQHHHLATAASSSTSVDDLVALWFAGPSVSGVCECVCVTLTQT